MDFKGKVAIVTGASSGIGLATAQALYEKGAKVALAARSLDRLQEISNQMPGSYISAIDMTAYKDIANLVENVNDHFGRIDILINNAGQGYDASIENIEMEHFHYVFELDFIGPLLAMQQVIPIMKANGGGSIINISSGTALMHLKGMGAYAAIKAAMSHISLTAREELADDGINVSVIYPYITKTDFETNTLRDGERPAGRRGSGDFKLPEADSPEDVAKLIIDCLTTAEAEVYAHDWMDPKKRKT